MLLTLVLSLLFAKCDPEKFFNDDDTATYYYLSLFGQTVLNALKLRLGISKIV